MGHANETFPDHKLDYTLNFFLGIYVFDVSPYPYIFFCRGLTIYVIMIKNHIKKIMCGKYQWNLRDQRESEQ